jgi:hypothetical protein
MNAYAVPKGFTTKANEKYFFSILKNAFINWGVLPFADQITYRFEYSPSTASQHAQDQLTVRLTKKSANGKYSPVADFPFQLLQSGSALDSLPSKFNHFISTVSDVDKMIGKCR